MDSEKINSLLNPSSTKLWQASTEKKVTKSQNWLVGVLITWIPRHDWSLEVIFDRIVNSVSKIGHFNMGVSQLKVSDNFLDVN